MLNDLDNTLNEVAKSNQAPEALLHGFTTAISGLRTRSIIQSIYEIFESLKNQIEDNLTSVLTGEP